MPDPMLTKRELATWLHVSLRTIDRLKPPAVVVGARCRYDRAEVQRWLATKEQS